MAGRRRFLPSYGVKAATPTGSGLAFATSQSIGGTTQPYQSGWDVNRAVRQGLGGSTWVMGATFAIALNQAKLPIVLRRGTDRWNDPEENLDNPLLPLLNVAPNFVQSAFDFRFLLSLQVLLSKRGAFIEVVRTRGGDPYALYLLPCDATAPIPHPTKYVSGYVVAKGTYRRTLPAEDVIWVRVPHPVDLYGGLTPMEAAGLAIDTNYLAHLYNRTFLLQDGRPGGILAVSGGMDSEEDAEDLHKSFVGGAGAGPQSAGRVTVLDVGEGGVTWVDTATTPRDAQWLEGMSASKDEILGAFRTPESIATLNVHDATYANAEQGKLNWWDETEQPHVQMVLSPFDRLIGTQGLVVGFDGSVVPVLGLAKKAIAEQAREDWKNGIRTLDEARKALGLPEIGGDEGAARYAPMSFMPIGIGPALPAEPVAPAPLAVAASLALPAAAETRVKWGRWLVDESELKARKRGRETRLKAWERTFESTMRAYFKRQRRAVLAKVSGKKTRGLALEGKDIGADDVFDSDAWDEQLASDVGGVLDGIAEDFGGELADALGVTWDLDSTAVQAALKSQVNRIKDANQTTFDAIAKALADGYEAGETIDVLAARVEHVFDVADSVRAERIARTETLSAANSSSLATAADSGVVTHKQWLCLAAGTRVVSGKPREVVERRRVSGWLTRLRTRSGRLISVTPNHPVLTDRGWIPAHLLDVGHNLISYSGSDAGRPCIPTGVGADGPNPDVQHMPAEIDEVFRAASQLGTGRRMMSRVRDLYSDPVDCEVEVVSVDGDLAADLETPFREPVSQFFLELSDAHLETLVTSSAFRSLLVGQPVRPSLQGGSSGFRSLCCDDFSGSSCGSDPTGFGLVSESDAMLAEDPLDDVVGNGMLAADRQHGLPALVGGNDRMVIDGDSSGFDSESLGCTDLLDPSGVQSHSSSRSLTARKQRAAFTETPSDRLCAAWKPSGDLVRAFASQVTLDQIVNVEFDWIADSHAVYDLCTENGWLVAEGLIVHNSTLDERTRESHADADGQEVGLDEQFDVGGGLDYPGDPAGDPEETINCRCSLQYVTDTGLVDLIGDEA